MDTSRLIIFVAVFLSATAPFASAKESCDIEKMMLGFTPEPSRIAIGRGATSIEIHHTYKSPSTLKTSQYLTCRLHLDCTVAAGVAALQLPVEETKFGVGRAKSVRKVVRTASSVDFKDAKGTVMQSCRIVRIADK